MKRFKARLMLVAGFFILLALDLPAVMGQAQPPPFDIDRIRRATVLVMQTELVAGKPVVTCVSSGTFISRDGLILTNAHSTTPNSDCPGNQLIIALSIRPDEPPVGIYQADIIQVNEGLDLALLRVSREYDGRVINSDDLALPFVELDDSNNVQLDETLWVVGYPGIGDDPVVDIRVSVPGFIAEPGGGEKSWFKIAVAADSDEGSITGIISGGGAYNRSGKLVGIPTTAPITRTAAVSECRVVQDTNSDGLVNQNDNCIPLGGSINVLRPVNFAAPLLRSASLDLEVNLLSETPVNRQLAAPPSIPRLFFAASVSNNTPTSVISSLPAGSTSLYLFFDYENMTPETVYELLVTIRGVPASNFSLSPVRWSGGERGLWYIGTTGQVLPNGDYEFTLFINGLAAAPPARITVGGSAQPVPSFRSPEFAIIEDNQAFGSGYVLGTGTTASARFVFNNMNPDLTWTQIWYYNGTEIPNSRQTGTWTDGRSDGAKDVSLQSTSGLPPGRYRLELGIDGRLAALGDFTIAGAREGALPRIFSETRFVIADSPADTVGKPGINSFTTRVERIYALFKWENIAAGTIWRMRWYVDNTVFYDRVMPWNNAESGDAYLVELTAPDLLPDGTYRLELSIDNVVLQSKEIQLGIGQLPIDPFTRAEGVQLRGQVIDSSTREGIADLTVVIISEQFSIADYQALQNQVYALATTDRNGNFQVDRPLQFGAPYSMLIAADGYLPIAADGVVVDEESPNPFYMTIYLTRD